MKIVFLRENSGLLICDNIIDVCCSDLIILKYTKNEKKIEKSKNESSQPEARKFFSRTRVIF